MDSQWLFRLKRRYEFTSYFILALFLFVVVYYTYFEDGRQLAAIAVSFVAGVWVLLGILKYFGDRSRTEGTGQ